MGFMHHYVHGKIFVDVFFWLFFWSKRKTLFTACCNIALLAEAITMHLSQSPKCFLIQWAFLDEFWSTNIMYSSWVQVFLPWKVRTHNNFVLRHLMNFHGCSSSTRRWLYYTMDLKVKECFTNWHFPNWNLWLHSSFIINFIARTSREWNIRVNSPLVFKLVLG